MAYDVCFVDVMEAAMLKIVLDGRRFSLFNPVTAKGPFLGHTYNYVDCHRATFRPLVWREILNFLCYGIAYGKRKCREKSFSNRIQRYNLCKLYTA